MRVLFIVKQQGLYGDGGYSTLSSGLFNSAVFVADMLSEKLGVDSKLVIVTDNNDIDREVTAFRPDIVIIEALWVVPDKFPILAKIHPTVKWIVRLHSALPFLAREAMAMQWLLQYSQLPFLYIGSNDARTARELKALTGRQPLFLPNYYPQEFFPRRHIKEDDRLDIGCFGAIRELKNQLVQAVAAISFADSRSEHLYFHMNGSRIESLSPILDNISALFSSLQRHTLVLHPWLNHDDFIAVLRDVDISMQVSYSETFNMVTADAVMNDVPIVVSPEIRWTIELSQADPTRPRDIIDKLELAMQYKGSRNMRELREFDHQSIEAWREELGL